MIEAMCRLMECLQKKKKKKGKRNKTKQNKEGVSSHFSAKKATDKI